MSVIAARVTAAGIAMAVDSQTMYGDNRVSRGRSLADMKLWASDQGVMIAFVGTSSLGSMVRRWSMDRAPEGATEADITAYVDAFHRWRITDFESAGATDGVAFLLAFGGRLWVVDGYSISEVPVDGYMAHGAGMGPALGALHCGASVEQAVEAACAHAEACGLPVIGAVMTPDGTVSGTVERLFGSVKAKE